MGIAKMMSTGTVKSFIRAKGYGFIRVDSGGRDIFFHQSALQQAGLANLRKGQKISFEIFDNQGRAAARNLHLLHINGTAKGASEHELVSIQNGFTRDAGREMSKKTEQLTAKRTPISRAALEVTIADTVRETDPRCGPLIGVIVERVVPKSAGGANWAVKGVKYGKADRERCSAAISSCVKEKQREFDISD
jgi:cold shock CspA family protein